RDDAVCHLAGGCGDDGVGRGGRGYCRREECRHVGGEIVYEGRGHRVTPSRVTGWRDAALSCIATSSRVFSSPASSKCSSLRPASRSSRKLWKLSAAQSRTPGCRVCCSSE